MIRFYVILIGFSSWSTKELVHVFIVKLKFDIKRKQMINISEWANDFFFRSFLLIPTKTNPNYYYRLVTGDWRLEAQCYIWYNVKRSWNYYFIVNIFLVSILFELLLKFESDLYNNYYLIRVRPVKIINQSSPTIWAKCHIQNIEWNELNSDSNHL